MSIKKYLLYLGVLLGGLFPSCVKENINEATGELNPLASIYVIRSAYKEADIRLGRNTLSGAYRTTGKVIATGASGNFPEGYLIIQDNWRGLIRGVALVLDKAAATSYAVGDSILVDLEGSVLSRSGNGPLTITGLNAAAITKISSGHPVTVRPVTINELKKAPQHFENTLVSVTADVTPLPVDEKFAGSKILSDGGDSTLTLLTEGGAVFANEIIKPSATFVGIPMAGAQGLELRLRSLNDMLYASGPKYPGYPEDFESPDDSQKNGYAGKNIDLRTGNWRLEQCLLGVTTGRDRIVSGEQAIRFQQNLGPSAPCYLQMNYDLPNGATKVTFWYGCYYTDAASSFVLEASTDQGVTWKQIGDVISDPEKTSVAIKPKQATFIMDIEGNVRFRIRKLPLGTTSIPTIENGRLGVDDIAIYQNY
ncbi:DUF5689 domain-containing protein [Longitalea luteola]|uniref:DUF5689 domain-containing protein n=1 Tax=Longitalea luteola TaxID=2812563 RepID=UPI001A959F62|nr:DUF5689 domain-containing protein [Longitalea luteola]